MARHVHIPSSAPGITYNGFHHKFSFIVSQENAALPVIYKILLGEKICHLFYHLWEIAQSCISDAQVTLGTMTCAYTCITVEYTR